KSNSINAGICFGSDGPCAKPGVTRAKQRCVRPTRSRGTPGRAPCGVGTDNQPDYDVVVVGGGHNGLVAAAYLARAGLRVRLLERLDQLGRGGGVGSRLRGRRRTAA